MKKTLVYLCILLFAVGCKTSRHINNGDAMMSQRNYERAASEYHAALRNSPNNVNAFAGLQNASDQFVKGQLNRFDDQYRNRQYVQAAETIDALQAFIKRYAGTGIKSNIPESYLNSYESITNAEAEFYYQHGQRELGKGSFNGAVDNFKKALAVAPNYKNARTLLQQAEKGASTQNAERYYQNGVRNYQAGNYRQAYHDFENSLKQVRGYKNAAEFQGSSLEHGKVRIAIFDFGNDTRAHGAQNTLYSYVMNNVVNNKSPFIDVVDRQNLDRLLGEINFSYSGSVNPALAARAGEMMGLNYIVTGKITNVIEEGGQLLPQTIEAYELYHTTVDGVQVPRGRPTRFTLYNGSTQVTIEAQYQIISVETGQIVKSNIISSHDSDAIQFARYSRNPNLLYLTDPGLAADGKGLLGALTGLIVVATRVNQELFSARTNLKTPSELQTGIMKNIGQEMAKEIIREFD